MRIITLNANGIRAAARKGFFEWMHQQDADVVCIQETKAQHHQVNGLFSAPPSLGADLIESFVDCTELPESQRPSFV